MKVKVVIACTNAQGEPDFAFVIVRCTQAEFDDGIHYETAKGWAIDNGYGGPFVCFDNVDGPAFLFNYFTWPSASVI